MFPDWIVPRLTLPQGQIPDVHFPDRHTHFPERTLPRRTLPDRTDISLTLCFSEMFFLKNLSNPFFFVYTSIY